MLKFKTSIAVEDRARITAWLGDSHVWMETALEKDRSSGRQEHAGGFHCNELNVAHVCAGLAFELALKALATSEGHTTKNKHQAVQNYHTLSEKSQARLRGFVEERMNYSIEHLLEYLDEELCHPDRKYWMVRKDGSQKAVGFVQNVKGLVIPDLANVYGEIVEMAGENTYENWLCGTRVRVI